jgi:hypothetical protein
MRENLFRQYMNIRGKIGTIDVLGAAHIDIVQQRFSCLLWASIGAFSLRAAALNRSVYEAESRHDWDAVLYRFLGSPKELVSPNVLCVYIWICLLQIILMTNI